MMVYMLVVGLRFVVKAKGPSRNLIVVLGAAFLIFAYLVYVIRPNSYLGQRLSGALTVFHGLFALLIGPLQENSSQKDVRCCVISGLLALGLAAKVLHAWQD